MVESNKDFPEEFFFDSEDDFERFIQADINGEVIKDDNSNNDSNLLNGYYHPWLIDF